MTVFGIHTNAQNKSLTDLIEVWKHADALGYEWISISDHFPGAIGPVSNEAVVTHTALAASTTRARCGVLVYSIGFRHPAVLATAATTIDHLSGGRAAIGLGSGAIPKDYELYGFPFPSTAERLDMLEEGVACVASLLHDDRTEFHGKHFRIEVDNTHKPLQERLPVWVGTLGEKRGLRIVAQYADGWNAGFPSPEVFAHKRMVLLGHCEAVGRDPSTIAGSVNLVLMHDVDPEKVSEAQREQVLVGSTEQIVDRIGRYTDAGADQVNFFLPYPWPMDGLVALADALGVSSS
ncbi:MAG: LLM class flavin-dependent oxidoreductase [Actinobacteria bacterium]|nr:LLM class flavin-dependent oxidoreductase [Actinomycetota bacterium]